MHISHFHFIGIGGIGMSALALILRQRGHQVSGSDCNTQQKTMMLLQEAGCTLFGDHNAYNIQDSVATVICTAALSFDNPELLEAKKRNLHILTRAELLASLINPLYGIAVAGAHGKTTTSALTAHILMCSQMNPSFAIGGFLHNYGTNARAGASNYFIAETCENDKATHIVHPQIAIITNIDYEHLDIYANLDEIKAAFMQFMHNVPENGHIIACIENEHVTAILQKLPASIRQRVITYGFSQQADFYLTDTHLFGDYSVATICSMNKIYGTYTLTLPGKHNLLNSAAAYIASRTVGVSFDIFSDACFSFKGVDRRFTFKGTYKGAALYDDYGHHPNEIKEILPVALRKAQEQGGRLIVAFQPHRFSRTELLWNDFVNVFAQSSFNMLMITDIYSAFEQPRTGIQSNRLAEECQQRCGTKTVCYIPEDNHFSEVKKSLDAYIKPNDLVLFLGAGKINSLIDQLKSLA